LIQRKIPGADFQFVFKLPKSKMASEVERLVRQLANFMPQRRLDTGTAQ
jgi:hypothetical protein